MQRFRRMLESALPPLSLGMGSTAFLEIDGSLTIPLSSGVRSSGFSPVSTIYDFIISTILYIILDMEMDERFAWTLNARPSQQDQALTWKGLQSGPFQR